MLNYYICRMVQKIKAALRHFPNWIISGVVLVLILWLTLAPHPTGDIELPLFPGADKVAHGILFGLLAFTICLDWMRKRGWRPLPLPGIGGVAIATALAGVGIEIAQEGMGLGRSFEFLDIMADTAGAMIGAGIWAAVNNLFGTKD